MTKKQERRLNAEPLLTTATSATDRGRPSVSALPDHSSVAALSNPDEIEEVRRLLKLLCDTRDELPADVQRSLRGAKGMLRLYVAMTEMVESETGFCCTWPEFLSCQIAEVAPHLYAEFGGDRIVALGRELQQAEFPDQSEKLQEMFQAFNAKYFSGRLPEYRILAVYDVADWQRELLDDPGCVHAVTGFIDFSGRTIVIGVVRGWSQGRQSREPCSMKWPTRLATASMMTCGKPK
jgi:hypothetical protein